MKQAPGRLVLAIGQGRKWRNREQTRPSLCREEDPGKQTRDTARSRVPSIQATRPGQGSYRQANSRRPEAREPGAYSHRAREEIWLRSGRTVRAVIDKFTKPSHGAIPRYF